MGASAGGDPGGISLTSAGIRKPDRVFRLSSGFPCVILRLAVLVEHRLVTDRHTHTDSQTRGHSVYLLSCGIAAVAYDNT